MPALPEIIARLDTASGLDFENAVADAFNFLGLKAEVVEQTEAESDVIVEASLSERPYYVVVECCAVLPQNQVPYDKLGQIRGNFTKYMDERRQKLFRTAYKLIVGRPIFSEPTKTNSEPDVGLLQASVLTELLQHHSKYHFSQDELEGILKIIGEVRSDNVLNILVTPYQRKLKIYALICISLLEDPYSIRSQMRKPCTPVEQIVGEVKAYAKLLRVSALTDEEINAATRDLCNPFVKFLELRGSCLRLSSLPFETIETTGGQLGVELSGKVQEYLNRLREMQNIV